MDTDMCDCCGQPVAADQESTTDRLGPAKIAAAAEALPGAAGLLLTLLVRVDAGDVDQAEAWARLNELAADAVASFGGVVRATGRTDWYGLPERVVLASYEPSEKVWDALDNPPAGWDADPDDALEQALEMWWLGVSTTLSDEFGDRVSVDTPEGDADGDEWLVEFELDGAPATLEAVCSSPATAVMMLDALGAVAWYNDSLPDMVDSVMGHAVDVRAEFFGDAPVAGGGAAMPETGPAHPGGAALSG